MGPFALESRAAANGPSFALAFELGRATLSLARPFPFSLGVIEALEVDFGRIAGALDLKGGPSVFERRRGELLRARVRVELRSLDRLFADSDHSFELSPANSPTAISVALHGAHRTVGCEANLAMEGSALRVALTGFRTVRDVGLSSAAEVLLAVRNAGASFDADHGLVHVPEPITALLTEALCPHGIRVPEATRPLFHRCVLERGALMFEAGEQMSAPVVRDHLAFEEARVAAPVLDALFRSEPELAATRAAAIMRSHPTATVAELEDELAPDEAWSDRVATGPYARLRRAYRSGDLRALVAAAREIDRTETISSLAIEALNFAAERAEHHDPQSAVDLSSRALGRRPSDANLALAWLERLSMAPDRGSCLAEVRSVIAGVDGSRRAWVIRRAAAFLESLGEHAAAQSDWEEANRLAPDDPAVLEGLAASLGRSDRSEDSLRAWDRLAALRHDDTDARAHALARAAVYARRLDRAAGAAARLEQAATLAVSDEVRIEVLSALSEVRRELGSRTAAVQTDSQLLELVQRAPSPEGIAALVRAARAAIEDGIESRGRAFVAALSRLEGTEEIVAELSRGLDRLELDALEKEASETGQGAPEERAERARSIGDRLRAAGRFGDAARAFLRAAALERDPNVFQTALQLADLDGSSRVILDVLESALSVLPDDVPSRSEWVRRRDALAAS